MNRYQLELYVAGRTPASRRAVANLRNLCDTQLAGASRMSVIDVLERPAVAEEKKILATPTLVRAYPPPVRRIIGDLSDPDKVMFHLDMVPGRGRPAPLEGEER